MLQPKKVLIRLLAKAYVICCVLGFVSQSTAQEKAKTHKVEIKPFKVEVEVDGVLESAEMSPVAADTNSWSDLVVEKIVPEGTVVKKGDPIVWFKTEKIDKAIRAAEYASQLSRLGIKETELSFQQLESTLQMDIELAERSLRIAEEDHKYYLEVSKPLAEKSVNQSLKSARYRLENSQEELDQLQKMYNEDELTEESEAIVLKRAERSVEQSQFWLESAEIDAQRKLDTEMPREMEKRQDELERKRLEYRKSQIMLPLALEKKKIEFDKSQFNLKKESEDLKKLKDDREMMVITAPADGVVYYGRSVRGAWLSVTGTGSRDIQVGKVIPAKKDFVTIVNKDNVFVRADLSESNLAWVKMGMAGAASSSVFPDQKMRTSVNSISYIPVSSGKYDARFEVSGVPTNMMPGMKCKIKMKAYENPSAIAIPSDALFTDDDTNYYVYVQQGESSEKRSVTKGKSYGGNTEITTGLNAGESVLLNKP